MGMDMKLLLLLLLALVHIVTWLQTCATRPLSFSPPSHVVVRLCTWQENSSSSAALLYRWQSSINY
jgi:hypothetical protein